MQQREAKRVLDEQVAYNRRYRAKAREDEMAADRKHLSKYGAMADQLKYQQGGSFPETREGKKGVRGPASGTS